MTNFVEVPREVLEANIGRRVPSTTDPQEGQYAVWLPSWVFVSRTSTGEHAARNLAQMYPGLEGKVVRDDLSGTTWEAYVLLPVIVALWKTLEDAEEWAQALEAPDGPPEVTEVGSARYEELCGDSRRRWQPVP